MDGVGEYPRKLQYIAVSIMKSGSLTPTGLDFLCLTLLDL